ncbi:hypothetical protein P8V03_15600 [Clostridium sp. A1-XYC3]|uniref:SbsA Ig-like domain-containing protein n=1 Tax=Clostridium tanneri TaxID=3037988 RepID=A0ABU4JWT5_9CLOT|nr:hypothetical protein [Clostridium sp. A1-XYC3]MDW8802572.1 hypothetical protein [Clostridium sp. A1-XYC3]
MNNKKQVAVLSTAALSAMFIGAASTNVQAADRDMTNLTKNVQYLAEKYRLDPAEFNKLLIDLTDSDVFSYEYKNAKLDFTKLDSFIGEQKKAGKTITQALDLAKDKPELIVTPVGTELKVDSVSAITKTQVKVVLSTEVDSVAASNFKIEGGNVTAATLASDKKSVTLAVSGLEYSKDYTLSVTGVLVDGKESNFGTKTFKTPAVTDLWDLQVSSSDESIVADGADNTVVTFKLMDKVTKTVDTEANDIVLDLNTTYGTLAAKRVTVQKGVATVILTSEFSNTDISAKIDAQIIEASGDYKDLINNVAGTGSVSFKTATTQNVETVTLVSAEANQADRITLFFDKEVSLKHFVKTNDKGELLYTVGAKTDYVAKDLEKTSAEVISHTLKLNDTIKINQGSNYNFVVKGFKTVAGNSKAIEVILDKTTVLKDNADVAVVVNTVNSLNKVTNSSAQFKLTDARKPEATSVTVQGLNELKVKFSEAIADSAFKIDGRFDGVKKGLENSQSKFTYKFGEFNAATQIDDRDLATIELLAAYDEDGIADNLDTNKTIAGYFAQGNHTLQISSMKDFAYATDLNNMGTTQNLGFAVAEDKAQPTAKISVESPEQFRITFDKKIAENLTTLVNGTDIKLQKLNSNGEYADVDTTATDTSITDVKDKFNYGTDFQVTKVSASEYTVELKRDWTKIYDTTHTNKNYYNDKYRFVIGKGKITNVSNGLKNEEIKLDLNYAGSALNTPDVTSPVISAIERVKSDSNNFYVTMSEPVKLVVTDTVKDSATGTLAQGQTQLPNTTAQFIGKDKNGKTVTFDAHVVSYADENAADKVIEIEWTGATNPQTVVDAGGSENWTLVVRSLSDDIGNTAASATKEFKIEKSAATASPFKVAKDGQGAYKVIGTLNTTADDKIEITFTEGVSLTGVSDATNPAQYTINGKTAPAGTSIEVKDLDTNIDNGFEKVIITLPDGTLSRGADKSNVIAINKNLVSYDGSVLEGEHEFIVRVLENDNQAPTASDFVIGGTNVADVHGQVNGDTITFNVQADKTYSTGSVTLTDDVSEKVDVTVTLGTGSVTVPVEVGQIEALPTGFGLGAPGKTGAQLQALGNKTVVLADDAGNSRTYTIKFTAQPAQV